MKRECTCDAWWSGRDEAEWLARGAPSCTCTDEEPAEEKEEESTND